MSTGSHPIGPATPVTEQEWTERWRKYGPPRDSGKQLRKHVRNLESRMAFLEVKIDRQMGSEGALDHARAELHALIWALPILAREAGVEQVVFPMYESYRDQDLGLR